MESQYEVRTEWASCGSAVDYSLNPIKPQQELKKIKLTNPELNDKNLKKLGDFKQADPDHLVKAFIV